MKFNYKIGMMAVALLAMSSCAVHDPFGDDLLEVGQALPTVSWELGSTVANAGDSVAFKGKYYTDKEHTADHAEVWALVSRTESASATLKLTKKLAYTQTVAKTDTIRSTQRIASFDHSLATWNGHEFELNSKFPTSQTLKSVTWADAKEWDQAKFDEYYPEGFQEEFTGKVVEYLTKDSTFYNDLRDVYINYDFTLEQINGVIAAHPELNTNGELDALATLEAGDKSDVWYTKEFTEDDEKNIVGKYYIDVVDGKTVYVEVAADAEIEGKVLYDVYESSAWVFCRYDDNTGGTITTVRQKYMPVFKDLISLIPFTDWIYNVSDGVYTVSFNRAYKYGVTFKVVDTVGNVGYTTDVKEVELN